MAVRNAKLMALYPHKGNFRAPNIAQPFYFHVPGPYEVNTGEALVSENNVVSVGGIVTPNGRGLETVTWSSQFHVREYNLMYGDEYPSHVMLPPSSDFKFDDAFDSIDILKSMKGNSQVATLLILDRYLGKGKIAVGRGEADVSMNVILKSFTYREEPGEPDCRYYNITFQEFRPVKIRLVPRGGAPANAMGRPDKYGRFLPAKFTLSKQMGIMEVVQAAYHTKSTALKNRILKANGGTKWLKKLRKQGLESYDLKYRNGPIIFEAGVTIKIPAKTGPLFPESNPAIGRVAKGTAPPIPAKRG